MDNLPIPFRSLKELTWLKAGGGGKLLKISSIKDLHDFIISNTENISIIGAGSNLLIRDGGIKGVVLKLGREFNYVYKEGNNLRAGASVLVKNLAQVAARHNLAGFEFLIGIPGTVGGALAMNAGAFNCDISQILEKVLVMDDKGNLKTLKVEEIEYVYRGHSLPKQWVFLEAIFKGKPSNYNLISATLEKNIKIRDMTQPTKVKTCGSVFKNPLPFKAWQLIDKSGCRGLRFKETVISNLHCNFLINEGNASASDIEQLCNLVKQKVFLYTGVSLELELIIMGQSL